LFEFRNFAAYHVGVVLPHTVQMYLIITIWEF